MKLIEALLQIQYDSNWGIWAEPDEDGKFTEDAEARYGQRIFENGGLLDEKVYVCNGENIGDWLTEWLGCPPNSADAPELDGHWIDAFLDEVQPI
jgi:hypothetical protein